MASGQSRRLRGATFLKLRRASNFWGRTKNESLFHTDSGFWPPSRLCNGTSTAANRAQPGKSISAGSGSEPPSQPPCGRRSYKEDSCNARASRQTAGSAIAGSNSGTTPNRSNLRPEWRGHKDNFTTVTQRGGVAGVMSQLSTFTCTKMPDAR